MSNKWIFLCVFGKKKLQKWICEVDDINFKQVKKNEKKILELTRKFSIFLLNLYTHTHTHYAHFSFNKSML